MKYITQAEHEMSRIKGPIAVFGAAVLMAVVAACGNGAEPTSLSDGPVEDYVSLVDKLRAAGATVDPAGTVSADYFAPEGLVLTANAGRVETFEFATTEEANVVAKGVSATGSSIVTTMADGTESATMILWVAPPHFYKAGKLIVIYVGGDSDVIDALQEAMGPQFAEGESLPPAPGVQPTTTEIRQALEAAEGSEVTVSGFLVADKDGNTRLCSGLLESSPPQCGDDRIDLLGFDANSVPNTKRPQRPSEIQTARWTDSYITVIGIKKIGGLTEVRLSTETPR